MYPFFLADDGWVDGKKMYHTLCFLMMLMMMSDVCDDLAGFSRFAFGCHYKMCAGVMRSDVRMTYLPTLRHL